MSCYILHNICDDDIEDFIDMNQTVNLNQYPNIFRNYPRVMRVFATSKCLITSNLNYINFLILAACFSYSYKSCQTSICQLLSGSC